MVEEERRQGDAVEPLLSQPAGPSRRRWGSEGTRLEDVLCEMCGTVKKGPELITRNRILGLQVIEECCGAAIDRLFEEHGERFTEVYFEQFAEDPTNLKFGLLRSMLPGVLRRAQERVQEVSTILAESQSIVEAID